MHVIRQNIAPVQLRLLPRRKLHIFLANKRVNTETLQILTRFIHIPHNFPQPFLLHPLLLFIQIFYFALNIPIKKLPIERRLKLFHSIPQNLVDIFLWFLLQLLRLFHFIILIHPTIILPFNSIIGN
jgi:hypothetical protein